MSNYGISLVSMSIYGKNRVLLMLSERTPCGADHMIGKFWSGVPHVSLLVSVAKAIMKI
jgi:glycogen synthase